MKFKAIFLLSILVAFFSSCELEDNEIDNYSDDSRDKIVGIWDVVETNQIEVKSTMENYQVEILNDTSTTSEIIIANFYNIGMNNEAIANMSGLNLSIYSQNIDGFVVNGSGNISSDYETISLDYIVDDGSGDKDTVTAVYSKQ